MPLPRCSGCTHIAVSVAVVMRVMGVGSVTERGTDQCSSTAPSTNQGTNKQPDQAHSP